MAKFIEVKPFNFGGEKHRILINVEKNRLRSGTRRRRDIDTSIGCTARLFW